jgi:hypothetical protein
MFRILRENGKESRIQVVAYSGDSGRPVRRIVIRVPLIVIAHRWQALCASFMLRGSEESSSSGIRLGLVSGGVKEAPVVRIREYCQRDSGPR